MVKGISRRVVVIKSPDPRLFEEAIFFVREDALHKGVTGDAILREAQSIASRYVRVPKQKRILHKFPAVLYTLFGAGAASVIWATACYMF